MVRDITSCYVYDELSDIRVIHGGIMRLESDGSMSLLDIVRLDDMDRRCEADIAGALWPTVKKIELSCQDIYDKLRQPVHVGGL